MVTKQKPEQAEKVLQQTAVLQGILYIKVKEETGEGCVQSLGRGFTGRGQGKPKGPGASQAGSVGVA